MITKIIKGVFILLISIMIYFLVYEFSFKISYFAGFFVSIAIAEKTGKKYVFSESVTIVINWFIASTLIIIVMLNNGLLVDLYEKEQINVPMVNALMIFVALISQVLVFIARIIVSRLNTIFNKG